MSAAVVPLHDDAHQYAEKIGRAWRKAVEGIIETGAALIEAKAALAHGDFEEMVTSSCPFGMRTAQRLVAIANHPTLSNTTHASLLPASWRTLAELAKFEPRELNHALSNHWISSEMTRNQIEPLRRRVRIALGPRRRARRAAAPAPKPASFVARLKAALDPEVVTWLGTLDEESAEAVVERVARGLTKFHALIVDEHGEQVLIHEFAETLDALEEEIAC